MKSQRHFGVFFSGVLQQWQELTINISNTKNTTINNKSKEQEITSI